MVSPKTYRGYDEEDNLVCTCTAVNANEYINPAEVQTAINKVNEVVEEQMDNVCRALSNVTPDAEEAIIVQGTKMTEAIEETCEALKSLPGMFSDTINGMYDQAVKAHDTIQNQANDEAYNAVARASDYVRG